MSDDREALRERLAEALLPTLVNVTNLPHWMQTPALGRPMRPLARLVADALLPVVEERIRAEKAAAWDEALDAVLARADEGIEFGPTNYLRLVGMVTQVRRAALADDREGGEQSSQYAEDSCWACNDRHPLDGCADVGCRHNCEGGEQ